ncbi:MAG: thiol-disulfide oxidoreductase DCC family protein [Bacteroidetes bacterium]|nr:thiol-disulfide oxidoreductase DCC family protein [Bacteroidota bacterium]
MAKNDTHTAVVLFDGVCNFCNSSVNFVIDRDKNQYFKFGALQSEEGKAVLLKIGDAEDYLDSVVLVEGDRVYRDSAAALRIARKLSGLWPLMYAFIIVPRPIRNAVYRFIANHRYAWFGKMESCRIPTPDIRSRFI